MREGGKEGKENKNILFLTSLAFQWLGLWALTAEGVGSIPGQGRSGNCCMERPKKKEKKRKKKILFFSRFLTFIMAQTPTTQLR